jgi:hypothetical protein
MQIDMFGQAGRRVSKDPKPYITLPFHASVAMVICEEPASPHICTCCFTTTYPLPIGESAPLDRLL